MALIPVIGRGHGGTRAIASTLVESGVYMGEPLNKKCDLVPPDDMYEACSVIARHVAYAGDYRWDFSRLHTVPIDPAFGRLVTSCLASVLGSPVDENFVLRQEGTLARLERFLGLPSACARSRASGCRPLRPATGVGLESGKRTLPRLLNKASDLRSGVLDAVSGQHIVAPAFPNAARLPPILENVTH
jgi:hypothetical protein